MNKKYLKHINTLFVVIPMTFIMAFVAIAKNHGLTDGWSTKLFNSWVVMVPVAYITAFFIIPIAKKMAENVVSKSYPIKIKK
ncbi:MAG TPA: DUF2798 domain-containing protein [Anditalea sp.]|nr:DUF2798 domain-containing protein [Anditalea sp.]